MSFGNPFANAAYENDSGINGLGYNGFEVSLNYISGLPDPNIVSNSSLKLMFKSLLKRDDTTKEKALGELATYAGNKQNVDDLKDDLVLITWIQLYPKLSISESKTVRSLAHHVHTLFISNLQKSFAKYLKDSIPVLLTGIYDFDSSVSNSTLRSLQTCFNNDTGKVNNIWILFQSQILNFANQVLNKETVDSLSDDRFVARDEAELKYQRLVNSTISIVNHLIQLGFKTNPDKLEKSLESYQNFFEYENLWHYLLVNTNTNNQRIYKTLLSLLNSTLKVKPNLVTGNAWKLLSKRLLKSLSFTKKIDATSQNSVLYSSLIIPILSTLLNLEKVNPDFYAYDKSAKDRVIGFLQVGSLNSDAIYYKLLETYLNDCAIFDFTNEVDSTVIEKILHDNFKKELSKNLKFRNGADFILNSLSTYLHIINKFSDKEIENQSISTITHEVIEIKSPLVSRLIDILSEYVPSDIVQKELDNLVSENIDNLLLLSTKTSTPINEVLSESLNSLRQKADEQSDAIAQEPAFVIFDFIIKANSKEYNKEVDEFIDELPGFITPNFVDQPIQLLVNYSRSDFYNKETFYEAFDTMIIKLTFINLTNHILNKLDSFKNNCELLSNSTELKNLLKVSLTKYDFSNDYFFKPYLTNQDTIIKLYELADKQDKVPIFVDYYWRYNSNDDELICLLSKRTNFLDHALWRKPLALPVHQKIETFFPMHQDMKTRYFQSLRKHVDQYGASMEVEDHVGSLLKNDETLLKELVVGNYAGSIVENYGDAIDSKLSLGNPLQSNIFTLDTKEESFQFDKLLPLIKYGEFLNNLAYGFNGDVLINLNVISEIAIDYEFLSDHTKPQLNSNDVLQFQKRANAKLIEYFNDESFNSVVNQIITGDYTNQILESLVNAESHVLAFYHNRLLKLVLSKLYNEQSTSKILELDIDKFVKTSIRNLKPTTVLILTTVLSIVGTSLADPSFERLRNLVGSELIGLKGSEVNTVGLKKLIILNNFLNFDVIDPLFEPFQVQRFKMIVNEINKWLDLDVAYEPEFVFVRIQLLQFLTSLNNLGFEKGESFNELTTRILQDTIGIVGIGEGENLLEMKYYSLKLYLVLDKRGLLENDVRNDIQSEILEGFVNDKTVNINQPVYIYSGLLNRVLSKIPTKQFGEHYSELFTKFQESTNFELKRPLLSIIQKVIVARQQDQVIEFELSKEGDDLTQYKISQNLIDNVLKVPEFAEDDLEEEKKLINYLWNWVLILLNFKDVTLKLRSIYINQLQNENEELITKFLNFISLLINGFDDKKFLTDIENNHDSFINYEFENSVDDLVVEVRLLSIHLYYTILTSIGSLSSGWFNDIKDRNFKSKIENFTSKYIAPSLIENKLNDFELKIPRLTKDHENLKVKINRVTNEIKSTYLIDEQYLEFVFKIPSNYPLTNIEVLGPQRVGVKENQWKAWLLASQRIISLQNGEIFESLEYFLKNVSFHFKGFEECAICYSILHQDNSLPSKTCSTCKNKFHAGCLYKWFKSSGGNTCPLCRATFNFR